MVAQAIFEQRKSEYLAERYRREWYQFQAIDRLETKLRLGKNRLGLHTPAFLVQRRESARRLLEQ